MSILFYYRINRSHISGVPLFIIKMGSWGDSVAQNKTKLKIKKIALQASFLKKSNLNIFLL